MAFIQGRKITDGILIANELDTRAKREIRQRPLLEVDFAKAFDSISWTFLDSVLSQMNFGVMWRTWIKGCLQSARVSVLVNGSPTQEFSMERGLCQGDPLSPFLFILVAEALNTMKNEAVSRRLFHPVTLESNGVQHLQFSDDVNFSALVLLKIRILLLQSCSASNLFLEYTSTLLKQDCMQSEWILER